MNLKCLETEIVSIANKTDFTDAGLESARMYDGIMDETVIWNKVLTNDEISAHANATFKAGEVKFQVRSCDDSSCVGEVFKGPTSEADYYETSAGEDLTNVASNPFLQYKAFFSTNTAGTSPELYNVTVEGHTVVEPPELNIDSAWVDWNGNNITLDGSGLSWSKTLTGLSEGDYTFFVNLTYKDTSTTGEDYFMVKSKISYIPTIIQKRLVEILVWVFGGSLLLLAYFLFREKLKEKLLEKKEERLEKEFKRFKGTKK